MGSIVKRQDSKGKVSYQAKVRIKGFSTKTATFSRITDAKRWEQQTEAAMKEGRYFQAEKNAKIIFSEVIDKYVEEVLVLKPKSYKDQLQQLNYWKEKLGSYKLTEISSSLIAEHKNLLARGKTPRGIRSKATVNRYLAVLSHVFTVSVKEWEYCKENPVSNVSRFKEGRGRARYLSDEERERLLVACRGSENEYLYIIVVLALSTGARRNEIVSLKWDQVDLDREAITLYETKNGEIRVLPIQGHAKSLIEDLARFSNSRDGYLFPSKIIDAPVDITKSWRTALKTTGIADFRFHDLRHSAASYLAMNGASLNDIAEILGHKTLAMVKRYAHLSESHTKGVISHMNKMIFES